VLPSTPTKAHHKDKHQNTDQWCINFSAEGHQTWYWT